MTKAVATGVALLAGILALLASGCSSSAPPVSRLEAERDVAGLIEALRRDDLDSPAAARALGRIGDRKSVPALLGALGGRLDVPVIVALGMIGDRRAVVPLTRRLEDEEVWSQGFEYEMAYRKATMRALARIGDPSSVLTVLEIGRRFDRAAAVVGGDPATAATWLAVMGKPATPKLLALLQGKVAIPAEDATEYRLIAASALGRIGDRATIHRATPALTRALRTKTWEHASECLALIHRNRMAELLPLLRKRDTVLVYWGLIQLGKRGTEPELVRALDAFGTPSMAEDFANYGNKTLNAAAHDWAATHDYMLLPTSTAPQVAPGDEPESKTGWGTLK